MLPSPALGLYLGLTRLAEPLIRRKLDQRSRLGKEDPDRLPERLGRKFAPRPDGPLVWFHAASVGESLSILELLRQMRDRHSGLHILVTTGTTSSAELLALRLPDGVLHQFVPVDTASAVRGFLDHWRPDLAIWTESEFWPRLMLLTSGRGIPMVLLNGRVSERSVRAWRWAPGMAKRLMRSFDLMLVQTDALAAQFRQLGADDTRLRVTGSLKEGAVPLPVDDDLRKQEAKRIGSRPVWLAASTHEGEEGPVLAAHAQLRRRFPELLTLIVPRHPERGGAVAGQASEAGLRVGQRSAGAAIGPDTQVYVADTLGEMGLWYRLAPVAFIGGSLAEIGGHNPFEPAALGAAIIHGPFVSSFADIYQRLSDGNAALRVESAGELAAAVARLLSPDQAAHFAAAAWEVSSEGAGVTDTVLDLLAPYLQRAGDAPKATPGGAGR